eukprot:14692391-Alexandrium_andersonii.AAC.1
MPHHVRRLAISRRTKAGNCCARAVSTAGGKAWTTHTGLRETLTHLEQHSGQQLLRRLVMA